MEIVVNLIAFEAFFLLARPILGFTLSISSLSLKAYSVRAGKREFSFVVSICALGVNFGGKGNEKSQCA